MKSVTKLMCRDLKRAFGLRTLGIWVVMALFTIYFFFFSNGRRELVENNRLEYMSLFLPLIIFGVWRYSLTLYPPTVSGMCWTAFCVQERPKSTFSWQRSLPQPLFLSPCLLSILRQLRS